MMRWIFRARVQIAAILAAPLLLFGCSAIHLYDAGKESTAKEAQTKYAALNLPGVLTIESQNLEALLEEELRVVREAHDVRLDLAILRIVDDNTPIGATIARESTGDGSRSSSFSRRLADLGFVDVAALRTFLNSADLVQSRAEAVRTRDDLIYAIAGRRAPSCDDLDLPDKLSKMPEAGETPQQAGMLEILVGVYARECQALVAARARVRDGLSHGEVRQSYWEWQKAETALTARRTNAQNLERALKQASAEYEAAIKAQQSAASGENAERVKKAAADLRSKLNQAGEAADWAGVPALSESRVQAVDTILTALSGGTVDAKTVSDPGVQRAARVAEAVPSLAGEVEVLVRRSRAPAVSPLVIEKQHQLLLRDDALRRVTYAVQRVGLLETKYHALVAESRFLLAQHDGMCNMLPPGPRGERVQCDSLRVTLVDKSSTDDTLTCTYQHEGAQSGAPTPGSQDCSPLTMTWGEGLRGGTPAQRRSLWEATAGLGGRLGVARPQQDEADLRLAHLSHLEVAASDEFAIRAWDGLIVTPVNQLAAYHQTGIKPAELADLIIKAVGLGAIGVGVNR